jgi:hypothetical protein
MMASGPGSGVSTLRIAVTAALAGLALALLAPLAVAAYADRMHVEKVSRSQGLACTGSPLNATNPAAIEVVVDGFDRRYLPTSKANLGELEAYYYGACFGLNPRAAVPTYRDLYLEALGPVGVLMLLLAFLGGLLFWSIQPAEGSFEKSIGQEVIEDALKDLSRKGVLSGPESSRHREKFWDRFHRTIGRKS